MKSIAILLSLFFFGKVYTQNNIRITSFYHFSESKSYYLAWDIKTGKSTQYFWSPNDAKWESFEINLPANPLPGAKGNIMMDVEYCTKDQIAYYLVWDSKTGKSIQYFWSGQQWDVMKINLPPNPLQGAVGDIGMKMYFDDKDFMGYYIVWDMSSGKSLQYFWNQEDVAWDVFDINLPANPIK